MEILVILLKKINMSDPIKVFTKVQLPKLKLTPNLIGATLVSIQVRLNSWLYSFFPSESRFLSLTSSYPMYNNHTWTSEKTRKRKNYI